MKTAQSPTREDRIARLTRRIDEFEKYKQPHCSLMAELAVELARRFGLPEADIAAISEAALLHDIGLFAMSPVYHSMPMRLDMEDRIDLWRHSLIGEQQMAKNNCSRHAQLLVRWHHEWWNGTGYPDKLAFEDIPIGARILRAVELYSALSSDRPYRFAFSEAEVRNQLRSSAGIECDPYVIQALLALIDDRAAQAAEPALGQPAGPLEAGAADMTTTPQLPDVQRHEAEVPERPTVCQFDPPGSSWQGFGGSNAEQPVGVSATEPVTKPLPVDAVSSEDGPPAAGLEIPEDVVAPPELAGDLEVTAREVPTMEAGVPPNLVKGYQAHAGVQSDPPVDASMPRFQDVASPEPAGISKAQTATTDWNSQSTDEGIVSRWNNWRGSPAKRKPLLGFEASVFSQITFDSIAIPFCGWANLEWYLNARGLRIFSNDPRPWAAAASLASIHSDQAISPALVDALCRVELEDEQSPLANPALSGWFDHAAARFMDMLWNRIDRIEPGVARAQAIVAGLRTGDYARCFDSATAALKRPLAVVFRELASCSGCGFPPEPGSKSLNLPAKDFIRKVRADLLYLSIPPGHQDPRNQWREVWVVGTTESRVPSDDLQSLQVLPQSRKAYLSTLDELLGSAGQMPVWAIACQDAGLASVSEITELIEDHRKVKATYSKDTSEVAGGSQNYIIVAENG